MRYKDPGMGRGENLMKKAMMNIGIIAVSVIIFVAIAAGICTAINYVYWNTSILDDIYDLSTYGLAFSAMVASWFTCEIYHAINRKCTQK